MKKNTNTTGQGEETMKPTSRTLVSFGAVAVLLSSFWLQPATVHAGVCSEGTGLPPFLSSGTEANLLLVLDNSGSMLDNAYVSDPAECTDNTYDATVTYAGLFDSSLWYKWTDGASPWVSGNTYGVGDYVYTEGVFYKATAASGNQSVGVEITFDSEVVWDLVYEVEYWANGTSYTQGDFVQSQHQLYRADNTGTSTDADATDGITIGGSTGVTWLMVDSTWWSATAYATGDIVSDNGMLFRATSASTGSRPTEDSSGTDWVRLDEGYFEEVSYTGSTDAATAFSAAAGAPYSHPDLYVKIVSANDDLGDTYESTVPAFAASGNFLNWASSSKFDIQKKILTGGKYDVNEEQLVSQSRGCADHSFFKEVPVTNGAGLGEVLTLAIDGPGDQDWIDTTDFSTRISILGVSDGFIDSAKAQACQAAIDEIAEGVDANQGQIKVDTKTCLDYGSINNIMAESNSAYNHAMHECWFMTKKGLAVYSELSVNDVEEACKHIYDLDMPSAAITPENSGYVCYGVYSPDATGQDPTPDPLRPGYVGRCWEPATIPAGCTTIPCPVGTPYDTGDPRCFPDDLMYDCSGNFNANQDSCNKSWVVQLSDDSLSPLVAGTCGAVGGSLPAQWTDDANTSANLTECIQRAVWDYCQGVSMVEVIDPTDQIFDTGETWGLPGALIDSGVAAMFGTSRPLLVMKGRIKQVAAPEGVIQEVAGDLRIGAMAFHQNGAATECGPAYTTSNETIVQFCPDENKDGARVIAPIESGLADGTPLDLTDDVRHVDNLVVAINDIKATAWTPLAEAIYNALGYYGQNTNLRLDPDDFFVESESEPGWIDPVQHWCQDNYILVITEGSSTTDLSQDVIDLVTTTMPALSIEDGTVAAASEAQCFDDEGEVLLFGSTFLDDVIFFGKEAPVSSLYATPAATPGQIMNDDGELHDKQNVKTFIVTTGVLRDDGTTSECNPATIMENAAENGGTTLLTGENPDTLGENLTAVLSEILSRASAGSASSVISNSRSGSGAVYQAIFWPELTDNQSILGDNDNTVTWIGDVHSLFMSSEGIMYEDTIQDGKLRPSEDLNNNNSVFDLDAYGDPEDIDGSGDNSGDDKRIHFYYSENANKTRGCYNITGLLTNNFICPGDSANPCVAGDDCVEINDIKYLWSASDKLRDMDPNDRKIFTWNDANNDGIVQNVNEWFEFDTSIDWSGLNGVPKAVGDERGSVEEDFLTSADWSTFVDNDAESGAELEALNRLISWIRGDDNNGLATQLRSRQFYTDGVTKEWRLGDIIHSTPIVVSKPIEAYHYIYRDLSYGHFSKRWAKRRNMVYFGANDGMLHAVNGGFYYEHLDQFCCTAELNDDPLLANYRECVEPVVNGTCIGPDLGDEKWAYIPYNLQPHLKCLANPDYDHKYFVDHKPRIFDAQIFAEEPQCESLGRTDPACIHAGGWGTILVGSMRFGGSPVEAVDLNGDVNDKREFTSSLFILDITNPEADPVLLGEMTRTTDGNYVDLNYTTSSPSLIVMRDTDGFGDVKTDWYLVMGNGPTDLDGTNDNDNQGKLAILPLEWLGGQLTGWGSLGLPQTNLGNVKSFRIPNTRPSGPTVGDQGGVFLVPRTSSGQPSYISDIITVDFDVENEASGTVGSMYKADAVYFGTTDGTDFTTYPAPDSDQSYWDGGGRFFRLVTKVLDGSNKEIHSLPSEWAAEWGDNEPIRMLVDAKAPITAAQSVGYDGDSFWVFGGTGRFYDKKDKTDDGQYYPAAVDDRSKVSFFGIREPVAVPNCFEGILTWDTINWDINDNDNSQVDRNGTPGERGLLQVDNIQVAEGGIASKFIGASFLTCAYCTDNEGEPVCVDLDATECFPADLPTFDAINRDNDEVTTITRFNDLQDYIAGTGCVGTTTSSGVDGWYNDYHELRERNLGQAALLGGLVTYTGYRPFNDICQAEGESFLYGVHFQTGTAWKESVFGTFDHNGDRYVKRKVSLGRGLATTPSMHVGSGDQAATAFVQTSTGEIIEIKQDNLPIENVKSGRASWTDRPE